MCDLVLDCSPCSLVEEAWLEANRHKWIESQKLGYDLGDGALREWFETYWEIFCRRKWLQHLFGEVQWSEFRRDKFDVIRSPSTHDDTVHRFVLNLAHDGMENLVMLNHAMDTKFPMSTVREILDTIDVNEAHIARPWP